ncbi:MAG: NAD(P)/FAD-dependent oxidoreductase [Acidimicrobiaceae bacterium]|nr:NAD(P)/FAD-dependent oxidoreductase [Acidimicrobiaceae bacterium]
MSDSGTPFDMVVVGAGPAGLAAGAAAAGVGARVTVLDRTAGIGVPVRTSGGSFVRPLRRLGLPRHLWHPVRRVRLVGPGHDLLFALHRPVACVLDVRRTYQWLGARAVEAGAELRLRTQVRAPLMDGDAVVGVTLADGEEVPARLVIDASGYRAVIAQHLGLRPPTIRRAIGHEQEVYAPHFEQDLAVLVVGDEVAPGGYGWAFPCGEGRVRLGVGVVRPDSDAEPQELLASFVDRVPALSRSCSVMGPLEVHAGVMPAADPAATPLVAPGLLLAGDAGIQGSTLLGEGIRHAIGAGRLAGSVGAVALAAAEGRVPLDALADYPKAWNAHVGRQMRLAYRLHMRVCRYQDDDWERVLDAVRYLRPAQVAHALAGDLTPAWALRTLVTSPRVVFGASGRSLLRSAVEDAGAVRPVPAGVA